jgi:hypothetical protein
MASLSVKETKGREGGQDDRATQTSRRGYVVRWDSLTASETEVLEDGALPRIWQEHPDKPWLKVKSRQAKQRKDNAGEWDVTIEYTSDVVDIAWDTEEIREALRVDEDGRPILNSAGFPFDPPVEGIWHCETLTIVRNQITYDRDLCRRLRGSVNTDHWYGGPPYSSKCTRIRGQLVFNENLPAYWRVTYEFRILDLDKAPENIDVLPIPELLIPIEGEYIPGGQVPAGGVPGAPVPPAQIDANVAASRGVAVGRSWYLTLLDAGYDEWDYDADNWKKIRDVYLQPVSKPALLDGYGVALESDAAPVWLRFRTFKRAEFAVLNLPNPE